MMRLYLDTSVLSALARGQFDAERAACDEIKALARSGAVALFSSLVALEELTRLPARYVGPHLEQYDAVGTVWSDETYEEFNPATECWDLEEDDPVLEALRVVLPDEDDARHLAQAGLGCMDVFLTLDEKTILRFAADIRVRVGLRVLRPSEFVAWFRRADEQEPAE